MDQSSGRMRYPELSQRQSPLVDSALKKRECIRAARRSIYWCVINTFIASVLLAEMSCGSCLDFIPLDENVIYYAEACLAGLFLFNAAVDFCRYLGLGFTSKSAIELTPRQKKLLGVRDNEPGFRTTSPKAQDISMPGMVFSPGSFSQLSPNLSMSSMSSSPLHTSTLHCTSINRSPSRSPGTSPHGALSTSFNTSGHRTLSPSPQLPQSPHQHSFSVSPGTQAHGSFLDHSYAANPSLHTSLNRSGTLSPHCQIVRDRMDSSGLRSRLHNVSAKSSPLRSEDCITNQKSLDQYLKDYEEKEYKTQLGSPENAPANSASFWNFNRTLNDYTPILRKYKYQIACRSPQSTKSADTDPDDPATYRGEEVWTRLGIGIQGEELDKWIENLRKWLNQTILVRLMDEINNINKELGRMVSEDMQVGEVSIAVLKQLAITKSQHIPTLNAVIPYLEVCSNQEYLIQRIQELSAGGCMSGFKWSGGLDFKGKQWGQHLPNDCAIVMHMLCTYMDSRLPPHPKYPDGRTFTNEHFMKTPDKPDLTKDNLLLYQSKINPPHFKVIIENDTWDLPKGRNNMFYAILLFLHHVKAKQHGMLGRVNLGMSGINLLWVLEQ